MRFLPALSYWIAVLAACALWLAMLAIGSGDGIPGEVFRSLHLGRGNPAIDATRLLSRFGGWMWLTALSVATGIFLVWRKRPRRAATFLLMAFVGRLLVELQKLFFAHPRPDATEHLVRVSSMSFPSAHAANSMIVYLGIAALAPMPRRWRPAAVGAAFLASLLIGLSRIALGVHWLADVIGGWAFGLMWVLLLLRLGSARADPESEPVNAHTGNTLRRPFVLRVKEKGHGQSQDAGRPRSRRFGSDRGNGGRAEP